MKRLRDQGYLVADVEYRLPFSPGKRLFGERKDLFGFGDLLAVHEGDSVRRPGAWSEPVNVIVQVCRKQDVKAHIQKIRSIEAHRIWLSIPCNRIIVHGWYQKRERGLWLCETENVTL